MSNVERYRRVAEAARGGKRADKGNCKPCKERMLEATKAASLPACRYRSPSLGRDVYLCSRDAMEIGNVVKVDADTCRACGGE